MAPYEALYGRKYRSSIHLDEVGERATMRPEIVQHTAEMVAKIRDRMKTVQSRQKSYEDKRRRDLEFAVGDHVFIKITPMKSVMRFGKKGILSPRFFGPFQIIERVEALAYWVVLPRNLAGVHNVFHISMLRKYMSNPSHLLKSWVDKREIVEQGDKNGQSKWMNHSEEEATWEIE
ncbi:uncharacterized protein [Primulina eburnea]|uniref:uncharacterized protein n=1 Tax=Primulina eburnea TaxID=1245227 RepID=UPI003C6C7506